MTRAKRDVNRETVALGYDGSTTKPFLVDPVTGRLLIEITVASSFPATSDPAIRRDANRIPNGLVVTDDSDLTPKPLLTDSSGNLIIDLVIE